MTDNDFHEKLVEINDNVAKINHRIGGSGMALWRGILSGFGYVIGALVALIIIGWVLNVVGIIPAFRETVNSLKDNLQQTSSKPLQNR